MFPPKTEINNIRKDQPGAVSSSSCSCVDGKGLDLKIYKDTGGNMEERDGPCSGVVTCHQCLCINLA